MYILTEEGRKYLKEGFPENKLVEALKDGPMKISELKEKIENFDIAVQWARKKHLIAVTQDEIELLREPKENEEEKALRKIEEGIIPDENILKVLLHRKLIEKKRETLAKKAERMKGKEITNLTPELIITKAWKDVLLKEYNVEATGKIVYPGKHHPYNSFLIDVRRKLVELGFVEMTGPIIEMEFWNFDALYQPQNHPSRTWTQTYSLKYPKNGFLPYKKTVELVKQTHENGWKTGSTGWRYKWDEKKASQLMPRAHGTACSARQLAKGVEIPGKYFAIVRCFRPDVIDATHAVEFNQVEGIVIDEHLTFKDLLGILKLFAKEFAGADKVKFIPDYYPFTEPSVQLSVKHPEMGWIELAGAGIFREELTKPLGVDAPVIAWGIGIDRLAMFKLGIKDIRYLFTEKLDWLRKSKII